MLKKAILWLVGQSPVERLLLAATVVAALRMMLIHGVFLGVPVGEWAWFGTIEVFSGLAFAVLEGKALAYVSKLWVGLKPARPVDWVYWGLLAVGQALLLAAIIGVTAYAATSVRRSVDIDTLLGPGGAVAWSMFVTSLNPLMVILIGIARAIDPREADDERDSKVQGNYYPKGNNGRISVEERARFVAQRYHEVTPDELTVIYEDEYRHPLALAEAEAALLWAQAQPNGNGRRNGRGK